MESESDQNHSNSEEVLHSSDCHVQTAPHLPRCTSSDSKAIEDWVTDSEDRVSDESLIDSATGQAVHESLDFRGVVATSADAADGSDVGWEETKAFGGTELKVAFDELLVVLLDFGHSRVIVEEDLVDFGDRGSTRWRLSLD